MGARRHHLRGPLPRSWRCALHVLALFTWMKPLCPSALPRQQTQQVERALVAASVMAAQGRRHGHIEVKRPFVRIFGAATVPTRCSARPSSSLHDVKVSISGKGNCHDNSSVESFCKSLKVELILLRDWHTRREVEVAFFEYINGFYDPRGNHSVFGWKPPVAFEQSSARHEHLTGTGPVQGQRSPSRSSGATFTLTAPAAWAFFPENLGRHAKNCPIQNRQRALL